MNREQRNVLVVALLSAFIAPFMSAALNMSISDISRQFECGATTVTWVVNIYTLVTAALSVPAGHLADIRGRRRMLIIGSIIFCPASILCALSPNIFVLIAGRAAMAFGAAVFLSSNVPLALTYFAPAHKGRILGIIVTSTYVGLMIGPVLGGFLNAWLGWRSIFAIAFCVGAAIFVLTLARVKPDTLSADKPPSDVLGTLLFAVPVSLFMFGLSEFNGMTLVARPAVFVAVVGLVAFVTYELRAPSPVMQVKLFVGNPAYGLSNLAALLSFAATFAIGYTIAIYLQDVAGMSTDMSGVVQIACPVAMVLFSAYAGHLSDRVDPARVASAGLLVNAIGIFILSGIYPGRPLAWIIFGLVICGIGAAFFSSPNTNAVLSCVDRSHYSEANATVSTMRGLGQSMSIVIVQMVFSATIGNVVLTSADPGELCEAIGLALLICAGICLVGTVVSLVRGKSGGV